VVEVRAAAEEAEAAGVAEVAGKAVLVYSGRANASVHQVEVAAVVAAVAEEVEVEVEARVASNHRVTSFEVCL